MQPLTAKPESLTQLVYDSIRDAIVNSELAPDDRVTEAGLARQLEVSKTPVREALLKLQLIGLIETDGQRGGRIATPSKASIQAGYEVREALEVQATRIVAVRREPSSVAALWDISGRCLSKAENADIRGFRALDREFHFSIADATRNPYLDRSIRDAFDLTWALRRRDVPAADHSLACARQHIDIVRSIDRRDVNGAETAMREHIEMVREMVLEAFRS